MLNISNTTYSFPSGNSTFARQGAQLRAGITYLFPWVSTARFPVDPGGPPIPAQEAMRQKSTCYMRGLSERVNFNTRTGISWQWRRICFTFKGNALIGPSTGNYPLFSVDGTTYGRTLSNWFTGTQPDNFINYLFEGEKGVDFTDLFDAKVDTRRIDLKYDKARTLKSGNEFGVDRTIKLWHPMNKNLRYDDEQVGSDESYYPYSVTSKEGMGDYYVIDLVRSGSFTGDSADNGAVFGLNSTLYWHEK